MKTKDYLFFLLLSLTAIIGKAQSPADYGIKSGLYFTCEEITKNKPTVPASRLTDEDGDPISRLDSSQFWFYYKGASGRVEKVMKKKVFAYSQEGKLYVNTVETVTYWAEVEQMGSLALVDARIYYDNRITKPEIIIYGTRPEYYIIDFERCLMATYYPPVFIAALKPKEPGLAESFKKLPYKEKERISVIQSYVSDYNKKHPLTIPK